MRKGCLLLMLALMGGLGCLSSGGHVAKESRQAPPVQTTIAPPPPPFITPDQVTESNAPDMVQALGREMDYDANIRQVAPAPAPMPATATAARANTINP